MIRRYTEYESGERGREGRKIRRNRRRREEKDTIAKRKINENGRDEKGKKTGNER